MAQLRLLTDLLVRAAKAHPEHPALDFMGRTWSYGDLEAQSARVAARLQARGLNPGDRACLCLPNTPHYVIAYFAILRAGGIVVNMNPLYTGRELAHLVQDSGAKWAFVLDAPGARDSLLDVAALEQLVLCALPEAPASIESPRTLSFASLLQEDRPLDPPASDPEAVAVLQYTGGTTGLPKGAALTHAGLVANCLQLAGHDRACPEGETVMAVLPMFHVFALSSVLHFGVHTGAKIVLLPRFEMESFLAAMERTRPNRLYVVPTILIALNALAGNRVPPMHQLRLCVSGGAPLPLDVCTRFEQRTGCRVVEGYGLTEASPTVSCNPIDGKSRDGSAGVAFPDTVIEIRSLETNALLGPGEIGEVWVRGPQLMRGYWNRPEETAEVLVDGALRTGDVGYVDEDGYLFLVDRIKDLILCGGFNVYPRVIEDALYEHPDVAEAIVVGVPDAYRGEAPKAFVVLRPGASAGIETLRAFLADRVSKIEMPREIEMRGSLPRTAVGKLSKKELRDEARNG